MLDELIAFTSDLIRCRSTPSRPEETTRCAELLAAWMDKHDIGYHRLEQNGVPSLIVCGPELRAPMTILCHFDVVEGSDAVFNPSVRDGRLYGRGSSDDKYACALALMLYRDHFNALRKAGKDQSAMPFMLALTGDEEIGGKNGAVLVASKISTEFCMALDSGPHQVLTVKQKGFLRLTLTCTGKAAHGAYPWAGSNAAVALARDCLALEDFFAAQKGQTPQDAKEHWHPTCTLTTLQAGRSANQVPDTAKAQLDVRYTEKDDPDALIRAMQAVVSGTLTDNPADRGLPVSAGDSPWLARLLRHMPGVTPGHAHGACDTRHFSPLGIPCVAWGADSEESQHMEDEHLVLESARIVHEMLDKFLRDIRS